MSEESCCEGNTNVLFYACSGGANVAEIADRAARELMFAGKGTMFCLAGLGAGIEGMVKAAKAADCNVVIDGCDMDCGKHIFDEQGVKNYVQIRVTDLDIDKAGRAATEEEVAVVVRRVREKLAKT